MNRRTNITARRAGTVVVTALFLLSAFVCHAFAAEKKSVYRRVLDSGVLRCGYFEEPPFTIIDPNTGERSGIAVELTDYIARELGLKVEWVNVANFTLMGQDLEAGRYDAVCASVFQMPRGGTTDYTVPYIYVPVYGYSRSGVTAYDNTLETMDWSAVSVAGIDGEGATTVVKKLHPEAKIATLPPASQIAEMLNMVVGKKADMAFVLPTVYKDFERNNPGVLRRIESKDPLYVFSVGFAVKPEEPGFKDMLDIVVRQMIVSGELDRLIAKYDPDGMFIRPER